MTLAMFYFLILEFCSSVYREHPAGGHFAAMECPKLLAGDIHKFVNAVEKRKAF